jgi:hypothetical protein
VREFKAVALATMNTEVKTQTPKTMSNPKSGLVARFQKFLAAMAGVMAMMVLTVKSEDGDYPLYIDTDDGEPEGKSAYLDAEFASPAPDGEYKLDDGRSLNIIDGMVSSVSVSAMQEEDKDKEVAALKEEVEELKAAKAKAEANARKVLGEFAALKGAIFGEENAPAKGSQKPPVPAAKDGENIMERAAKAVAAAKKAKK